MCSQAESIVGVPIDLNESKDGNGATVTKGGDDRIGLRSKNGSITVKSIRLCYEVEMRGLCAFRSGVVQVKATRRKTGQFRKL